MVRLVFGAMGLGIVVVCGLPITGLLACLQGLPLGVGLVYGVL